MSVKDRRMFCLIWLLGGSGIGETGGAETGGAETAECVGLEDEEWLEGEEETGDDGTLGDEDDCLWGLVSFC